MSAPSLATEAGLAGSYPGLRFNARERVLLSSVKTYVDAAGSEALTNAHIYVGNSSNIATDVAMSGDATLANTGALTIANLAISTAKIAANAVTLAKLASGVTPSHVVKYAAAQVATTSGSATIAKSVPGVLSTDVVHVTLSAVGGTPRTILTAIPSTDTITIVFSGDPSTDHKYDYSVMRAAA